MIADDAVGFAILVHGFGDVGFVGVVVEGFQCAIGFESGDGPDGALPEQLPRQ